MTGETWGQNGVSQMIKNTFNGTSATENLEIIFFTNDYTPNVSVANGDLTEIGTSTGLGAKPLYKVAFSTPTITTGTSTIVTTRYNGTAGIVYTVSENCTTYGYAIRGKTTAYIYYVKNIGLHTFEPTDIYTINPFNLKLEI